jgi:lipopolysaccharide transport system permease protein
MISTRTESEPVEKTNPASENSPGVISQRHELPEKPLVVIEPSKNLVALNLRDLWHYRDLFYILTMRDIKVRYKQTFLGVAWAIIQPLFTMIIFSLLFGRLANMPSDGIAYPLFAFAGLLPWTFFSNAVTNSGNSLVGSSNLITKVYFPRMVIPFAAVAAGLLDLIVAFGLMILLMIYYGAGFSTNMLMLPVLTVILTLLAVGVGMFLSALNVKYRDIRYALPFLIQLGMFATPIIYPLSVIPEKWRWLMMLNPLSGLIEGFRAACFGKSFDWASIGVSLAMTSAILLFSAYVFRKMERSFADVI